MDARHWPGGIPPTILPHPHAQQDDFNFDIATQGFRKFLREHWKPRENEADSEGFEYEDTQRRELIETWACADQAFREKYQSDGTGEPILNNQEEADICLRGIAETATTTNCYCIASIQTPEDHGRMVKALLLQFVWDDEPMFPLNGPVSMLPPNPAGGPITPDNFKMARSVDHPDLTDMGMTVDGTVVFQWGETDVLIDNYSLETGLLLMNQSWENGSSRFSARVQPKDVHPIWGHVIGLGWSLEESVEDSYPSEEPIDLRPPLVDILLSQSDEVSREELIERIEGVAPGYLEAEEESGFAGEYDIGEIEFES